MSYPFLQAEGFFADMSTISDGNMDFRFGEKSEVVSCRARYMSERGFEYSESVWMSVDHGIEIIQVTKNDARGEGATSGISADAFMTQERNLPLCLLTADCTPLVLYDAKHAVLAIVHVGWKPAHLGIIERVLDTMRTAHGTSGADCSAYLFPGILPVSYIQKNPDQRHDSRWAPHIKEYSPGCFSVDIPGFIGQRLREAGIMETSIHHSNIDTATHAEYFSHYRSQKTGEKEGRMLTCAVLL